MSLLLLTGCAATSNPGVGELETEEQASLPAAEPAQGTAAAASATESPASGEGPELDAGTAAALATPGAPAREPWEKYSLSLGFLLVGLDSSVRFGGTGVGLDLNLEDALGFDSGVGSPRLQGSWRYTDNRRHRVSLTWVDLSRDATRNLGRDLDLGGGVVVPAGTKISTEFDVQVFRTEYSYSFIHDERVDMAAAFGLYVMPLGVDFTAQGIGSASESFDITAPLPMTGLRMDVLLTPKVYLRSHMNFFYLEFDDYKGAMFDTVVAFEWVPLRHVGIGLGYNAFDLGLSVKGDSDIPGVGAEGRVEFGYTGISLYLRMLL